MEIGKKKLSDAEITKRIAAFPDWHLKDGKLHREIRFKTFAQAFGFMTSVAIVAQQMDHHPDWSNVYDRVSISLNSHDVQGLSERDFELARQIDVLTPQPTEADR